MSAPQFSSILWDRPDDPKGNVQHIARHHLTMDDVEYVFDHPTSIGTSTSPPYRPVVFGETRSGRYIIVVYVVMNASTVRPVTAFDVRRPKRQRK